MLRALIVETLRHDDGIQVVGEARNGAEAIDMVKRLRPGLVILGDGLRKIGSLEVLREIMIEQPTPVVLATHDPDYGGAGTPFSALKAGALAIVATPPLADPSTAPQAQRNFLSMIRAMSQVKVVRRSRRAAERKMAADHPVPVSDIPARIVAMAASTGGPAALEAILSHLPADFPVPILIVQHISSNFIDGVASWLDRVSPLAIKIAEDGERLQKGTVYLGPDHRHLSLSDRSHIKLVDAPPMGGFRPSANYLFDAIAQFFEADALGVILTGMGQDGVDGLRAIRAHGGRVIAQDEASCVVFGMPHAAIKADLVTEVLPIDKIASSLIALAQRK